MFNIRRIIGAVAAMGAAAFLTWKIKDKKRKKSILDNLKARLS